MRNRNTNSERGYESDAPESEKRGGSQRDFHSRRSQEDRSSYTRNKGQERNFESEDDRDYDQGQGADRDYERSRQGLSNETKSDRRDSRAANRYEQSPRRQKRSAVKKKTRKKKAAASRGSSSKKRAGVRSGRR